mmetsp:Transcript_28824/g.67100  ORF Transcript_28824/g.67100 Transcript_28824/m.67100 type:complete len:697 (-) Transcript_28824:83-2173(-)
MTDSYMRSFGLRLYSKDAVRANVDSSDSPAEGQALRMLSSPVKSKSTASARNLSRLLYTGMWSLIRDDIFMRALFISIPPAIVAAFIEAMQNYGWDGGLFSKSGLLVSSEVYGVITALLGIMIVFRNGQAYARFWEACSTVYQMQGLLFDAASSLIAFCSQKESKQKEVAAFRHSLIRLLSLLNSLMIAELENATGCRDVEVRMPVLDAAGLDQDSVKSLEWQACKVEIVFQWIQQLAVTQLRKGVVDVPAPIATRAFQELGAGVLQYHEALKTAQVPFPGTYMATMLVLLGVHVCLTPIAIVAMVEASGWAFFLTFVPIFTLWTVALVGMDLDNPFYRSSNIVDFRSMQTEQNERLVSLIVAAQTRVPVVTKQARSIEKLCRTARESRKRPPSVPTASGSIRTFFRRGVSMAPLLREPLDDAGDNSDGSVDADAGFDLLNGVQSWEVQPTKSTKSAKSELKPLPPPEVVEESKMRNTRSGYQDYVHARLRGSQSSMEPLASMGSSAESRATASSGIIGVDDTTHTPGELFRAGSSRQQLRSERSGWTSDYLDQSERRLEGLLNGTGSGSVHRGMSGMSPHSGFTSGRHESKLSSITGDEVPMMPDVSNAMTERTAVSEGASRRGRAPSGQAVAVLPTVDQGGANNVTTCCGPSLCYGQAQDGHLAVHATSDLAGDPLQALGGHYVESEREWRIDV